MNQKERRHSERKIIRTRKREEREDIVRKKENKSKKERE
jgi:hypothetical protein